MEKKKMYRKYLFMGIAIIAMGIAFSTTQKEQVEPLGNLLVAVGGLLVFIGISKKKKGEKNNQ